MGVLLPLNNHGNYYIWKYVPNIAASIIFIIIWIIMSSLLGWRVYKTRAWFCIAFVIGCVMELIGYCGRVSAFNATDSLLPYVIQSLFILLPPALFAATIYMCLGRIIKLLRGEHHSIIKPTILTKLFVAGDVLSFLVQAGASGLMVMASTNPTMGKIGQGVVIAGLGIQLVSFTIFAFTALLFDIRIRKSPTVWLIEGDDTWMQNMRMLYIISVLIIIRSIFRIVEYVMGDDGYPLTHEWTLYVFDSIPMLLCAIIFIFRFPRNLVQKRKDAFQLESQTTQETFVPK